MKKHKKDNCVICDERIDKNKERYVNLRDFNGKKFESECFYHLDCWKNRFSITQETIQKQADKWMKMLKGVNKK